MLPVVSGTAIDCTATERPVKKGFQLFTRVGQKGSIRLFYRNLELPL
jgi:hypothetical protein